MRARVLPMGEHALLVDLDDSAAVLALTAALSARRADGRWPHIVEIVPAARTVLVALAGGTQLGPVAGDLADLADTLDARHPGQDPQEAIEVPVVYDGADLAEVAELTGLDVADVVAAHTGTPWRVAFTGFAPGFAYLVGGDPRLEVPRRTEPRAAVPAGSVALAGGYSGIYPRETPGGWQLLGRTDRQLWALDRDPPALLRPGMTVRFRAVDTLAADPAAEPPAADATGAC